MAAFSSMGRIPAALCEELEEAEDEPVALKYWLRSCIGKNHSGWRIFRLSVIKLLFPNLVRPKNISLV